MTSRDRIQIRFTGPVPVVGQPPRVHLLVEEVHGKSLANDLPIWRYMSLAKFVSMLASSGLWFSRLELLGDPFEGAAPKSDLSTRKDPDNIARVWAAWRRWLVVCCWHSGPFESDAMWKIYAPDGEGVAIRTSVGALIAAMESSTEHYADSDTTVKTPLADMFMGRVFYADHAQVHLDDDKLSIGRFLLKRPAFAHEQEVRVIAPLPEILGEVGVDDYVEPKVRGVTTVVDMNKLLHEVVICPTAPGWYIRSIDSLLKAFNVGTSARVSELARNPQY